MKSKVKLLMACVVSLALVWGVGGVSFADNAAEVVVQVSYPSGDSYVQFYNGAVGAITDALKDHYVNVHVTLLDANGDPATAGPAGEVLSALTATLTTQLGIATSIVVDSFLTDTATLNFDVTNVGPAARAHVKYACTTSCVPGDDTLEVTVGTLDPVSVDVEVRAPEAASLTLRTLRIAGAGPIDLFDAITGQSNNAGIGALAADDIYFEVWAVETNGAFTTAPELEGQTVTVSAYGDYDANATAGDMAAPNNAAVATATAAMSGGKATGTINITTAGTVETGGAANQLRVVLTATTGTGTDIVNTTQAPVGTGDATVDWVGMRPQIKHHLVIGTSPAEGNLVTEQDTWYVVDDNTAAGGPSTTVMDVFIVDEYGNPTTNESVTINASLAPVANASGATPTLYDASGVLTSTPTAHAAWNVVAGVPGGSTSGGLSVAEGTAGLGLGNQHEATGGGTGGKGAPLKGILELADAGLVLDSDTATVFLFRTAGTLAGDLDLRLDTDKPATEVAAGTEVTLYIVSASGSGAVPTTSEIIEQNDELVISAIDSALRSQGLTKGTINDYSQATSTLSYKVPAPSTAAGTNAKYYELPIRIWGPCDTNVATVNVSITDVEKGLITPVSIGPVPPLALIGDLEPGTESQVVIRSLAAGVGAQDLTADPIIITSQFTVGENSLLPVNDADVGVNTADQYNNTIQATPIYGTSSDVGVATVDGTRAASITFDAADVGETATVTVSVSGVGTRQLQINNIVESTTAGALQCVVEGPGLGAPGGEVILQVQADGTFAPTPRAVVVDVDTANSVTGSEIRDFTGTALGLPTTQSLASGSMVRLVVSAPEEGNVVVQAGDASGEAVLLDTGSCTVTFAVDDEDPTASIAPPDGGSIRPTDSIVITVNDNIGVDLGGTAYTIEHPTGTDITSTLSCVNAGDGTTSGTITCSGAGGADLDQGAYLASVTPQDLAGQTGTEVTSAFTVSICTPSVTISPATADLEPGETQQFTASTSCDGSSPAGTYTWDIMTTGCTGSSIDATGLYTAPATITGTSCSDTVRVTDTANGNVTDTATVTVSEPTTTTTSILPDELTVSPDPVRRSRWIVLPTLMVLQTSGSDFVRFGADRSLVTYSPANAVIKMPRIILGPKTMWQLVLVNPPWLAGGATDGTLSVTVTTGAETVTGTTNIQMLPLGLDK